MTPSSQISRMSPENNLCPICICSYKSPSIAKCGHSFCETCILESLKSFDKCPVCKLKLDPDSLFPNIALQSLQKELESNAKSNLEELKLMNKKKSVGNDNLAVTKEFLNLLEKKKHLQVNKLQNELGKIQDIKSQLGITNVDVLGKKRKAPIEISESDQERINRMHSKFEILSDTFTENQDWSSVSKTINSYTKYYSFKEISCFRNSEGLSSGSQIVSSIESDRNGSYFATAGVLKQINLFNLNSLLENEHMIHSHNYPSLEIKCNSKISCLSWNPFYENKLCCADYDGVLNMYDTSSGKLCSTWTEHEKRCWSVDTSSLDPQRLISGSDDCKVKLWSQKSQKSSLTIDIKVNVCSVRFSPKDANIIAVGAADHRVFLFDIRKPSIPLLNQKEHSKSVSYIRFNNSGSSLISASTDSTLRLWSQNNSDWKSERVMSGHLNEKNFVGLSVINDNLIATGSEDNTVVIYDQNITQPVLKYQMKTRCPLTGSMMNDELGTFISSVSLANRPDNQGNSVILAANSTGNISIISIIEE